MTNSPNLEAMIRRKALLREGSPEAEEQAEEILAEVERNGGLTTVEVYALMAH
jgi:hypothetical protein